MGRCWLATQRKPAELTQSKLAERVGLDQSYINQIEKGKRKGTAKNLKKIADALNIEVDSLI
ncbi:MAG: helix-turn-helix domain-containing protein [Nitrospinales bacterium]